MSINTPIKILRSLIYNKRPSPSGSNGLLEGQPALNYNSDQPGLFFKDTEGELIKIGPTAVGGIEPNSSSDPEGAGTGTNCLGEMWLDTSAVDGPTLKVWNGSNWIKSEPIVYARALISNTLPPTNLPEGTMWWNSENGLTYILYEETWVQMGSSVSSLF